MSTSSHDSDPVAELHELPREVQPSDELQRRTIAALRTRGLLRHTAGPSRLIPWALAAVVALAAFLGGYRSGQGARARPVQATHALMLYGASTGDDSLLGASRAAEYGRWARQARAAGRVVGGEALYDDATLLSLSGDSLVRADVERAPDQLVGYFLVTAASLDAALALAADCPHLRYGGRIVVRPIEPT
jgi:hypothetical protein